MGVKCLAPAFWCLLWPLFRASNQKIMFVNIDTITQIIMGLNFWSVMGILDWYSTWCLSTHELRLGSSNHTNLRFSVTLPQVSNFCNWFTGILLYVYGYSPIKFCLKSVIQDIIHVFLCLTFFAPIGHSESIGALSIRCCTSIHLELLSSGKGQKTLSFKF